MITSCISVPCVLKVVIWQLSDVDIPQLSASGILLGGSCFSWTDRFQFSSTSSPFSSFFDASGLEQLILFGDKLPSSTSHVVKQRAELQSIPLDVEDLWIQRFNTAGITEYSFNAFQSLKSLVIGNNLFWTVTRFELSNLPSLESIDVGAWCFVTTPSFSLTGLFDWLE